MTSKNHFLTLFLAGATVANLFSSCSKNDNSSTPTVKTSIQLNQDAKFGKILADSNGKSLYFYSKDADGKSACNGGCAVTWPVFYVANPTIPDGLKATDFGTITRTDGTPQTTYKGWPLYYYQADAAAGDVQGDAVGSIWFVAKPDYAVMVAKAQLVAEDGTKYNGSYKVGEELTEYMTDPYGLTLYSFSRDKFKVNAFTKADFSNNTVWPIWETDPAQKVYYPSILSAGSFDTLLVFGKIQVTYKGWPVYYYGKDQQVRGSNKGVGVGPGAWPILNTSTVEAPRPQ